MSAAARSYKTSAIVLRGRIFGEADRILTLFSTQRGKMDAIAKGARRTKSHLAGRLELGNQVGLTMHRGRTLDVVVSAEIEAPHWAFIVRPDRFAAANVVMELVDAFCEPDLALPGIYELLCAALAAIGRSDDPVGLIPRFSLRLLGELGLAPPLAQCVQCGAPFDAGEAWVEPQESGLSCGRCRKTWLPGIALDEQDRRNLSSLAAVRGESGAGVRARPAAAAAVETLIAHHLGRPSKAGSHAREFTQDQR